jgi:hypothetical protein
MYMARITGDAKVLSEQTYVIHIVGVGDMLMNKQPDMSVPKPGRKDAKKTDPITEEQLTWKQKAYFNKDGLLYVPSENLQQCYKDAAKFWGQKIPGEGKKTYTNVFEKATIFEDGMFGVSMTADDLIPFGRNMNGNPNAIGKHLVYKIRPLIPRWDLTFIVHSFDARLTPEVMRTVTQYAGSVVGIGDWRPTHGRFVLDFIDFNDAITTHVGE